jgi:hypothetical protein
MYNTDYTISATDSVHTRKGIYVQTDMHMYSLLYYVLKYISTNSNSGRM